MWVYTDWPHLLRKNPEALRQRILTSFIENHGNREAMWKDLGISMFTFYKYVKKLGLGPRLLSMRMALSQQEQQRGEKYAKETRTRHAPVISTPVGRRSTVEEMQALPS